MGETTGIADKKGKGPYCHVLRCESNQLVSVNRIGKAVGEWQQDA